MTHMSHQRGHRRGSEKGARYDIIHRTLVYSWSWKSLNGDSYQIRVKNEEIDKEFQGVNFPTKRFNFSFLTTERLKDEGSR